MSQNGRKGQDYIAVVVVKDYGNPTEYFKKEAT